MQHHGGHLPSFDQIERLAEAILRRHGGHREEYHLVADLVASFSASTDIDVMVKRIRDALKNAVSNNHLYKRNQTFMLPPVAASPVRSSRATAAPSKQPVAQAPTSTSSPRPPSTRRESGSSSEAWPRNTVARIPATQPMRTSSTEQYSNNQASAPKHRQAVQIEFSVPADRGSASGQPAASGAAPALPDRVSRKKILQAARRHLWKAPNGMLPAHDLASRTVTSLASDNLSTTLERVHEVLRQPQSGRSIQYINDCYIMDRRRWEELTSPAVPSLIPPQPAFQHLPNVTPEPTTPSSLFGDHMHRGRQTSLFARTEWTQSELRSNDDSSTS